MVDMMGIVGIGTVVPIAVLTGTDSIYYRWITKPINEKTIVFPPAFYNY
jgi:hypothetical protein